MARRWGSPGEAADDAPPLLRVGGRLGEARLVRGHSAELHQEGVPGVALVRAQRRKGLHLVGHQRGVHLRQRRLDARAVGPVHANQTFSQDVVHGSASCVEYQTPVLLYCASITLSNVCSAQRLSRIIGCRPAIEHNPPLPPALLNPPHTRATLPSTRDRPRQPQVPSP